MRADNLNDGTVKALLILILLASNIALTLRYDKAPALAPGSARASRAVFRALAENSSIPRVPFAPALGEAPRAAREARALPSDLASSRESYVARR